MKVQATPLRDIQRTLPVSLCPVCGEEQYPYDTLYQQDGRILCGRCFVRGYQGDTPSLGELSQEYEAQSQRLRARMAELRLLLAATPTEQSRRRTALTERLRLLEVMWRESRELTILTRRYYERGYRRNVKYTL